MTYHGRANIIGQGSVAALGTTETDVLVVTDQALLVDAQLNAFILFARGTHTSIQIRYYARHSVNGDWYELPYRNEGTGVIVSVPTVLDATTPARIVDSLPLPACLAFRVTAQGVGGAGGSATVTLMSRDN